MRRDLNFEDAHEFVFKEEMVRGFRRDLDFSRGLRGQEWNQQEEEQYASLAIHCIQAEYTILPPTIVATTFPVSCHPSKGVFFDFECDLAASKVHFFFGSKTVTSATDPRTSDPRPRRSKQRAGPAVKSSTMRARGIRFSRCSLVIDSASAVSSPVMPKAARSNSISFSWAAWGA